MKEVTVEELRGNLDELLSEAQAGELIMIVREGQAIATLRPTVTIIQRGTPYPFRNLKISPLKKPLGIDPIEGLIEERERERSGKKYGL
jgi:antitoxin (DNA-binding transcriptional repressor) of toxin-antitoxin stability system